MCEHRGDHRTGNCRICWPPDMLHLKPTVERVDELDMPQTWTGDNA